MAESNRLTLHLDNDLVLLDFRLNGSTANDVMDNIRNLVEKKLPVQLERCPASIFKKILDAYNLKKEFRSFAKETGISKEEVHAAFIKKRVAELLLKANKWAKIFVTEKEERTNKKQ